jgi:hypothetical protein
VRRVAVLRDAAISAGLGLFGAIQSAALAQGVEVAPIGVRNTGEIERAVCLRRYPERRHDRDGELAGFRASRWARSRLIYRYRRQRSTNS